MSSSDIPSLTGVKKVVEHGLDSVHFHVSIDPCENKTVTINPKQLMMSAGIKDLDHMYASAIQVDDCRLEGKVLPGDKAGIVFDYGPGVQTPTAHRVTHVNSNGVMDCVHTVATAAGLNHPVTFKIGPAEPERGQKLADRTKVGLARTARWQGINEKNIDHDVQEFTRGGETRYLVPHTTTETSSGVARLFEYNKSNRAFLNGKYHEDTRAIVGDGIVVNKADMDAAKETLKTNLTPTSAMAKHGLRIRHIDLGDELSTNPISLRFQIKRTPLSKDLLENADQVHQHDGMLTMADVGEDTVAGAGGSAADTADADIDKVFDVQGL